jgi:uncharacterized ion transporter superfamily protein YfcC
MGSGNHLKKDVIRYGEFGGSSERHYEDIYYFDAKQLLPDLLKDILEIQSNLSSYGPINVIMDLLFTGGGLAIKQKTGALALAIIALLQIEDALILQKIKDNTANAASLVGSLARYLSNRTDDV